MLLSLKINSDEMTPAVEIFFGIEQAFTSYNNPKGNANTERTFRTMKEDCIWINEFETYDQALLSIQQWINFYNNQYIHSSIENMSPNEFLQKYYTQKAA